MKSSERGLTHSRLLEVISYDQETGIFYRRASRFPAQIGKPTGCLDSTRYVRIYVDGYAYLAHRLAVFYVTGQWPDGEVDHMDGKRGNNVYSNLRDASTRMNTENLREATSKSIVGVLGVSHSGKTRYRAQICTVFAGHQVRLYLGSYTTEQEAHAVYLDAKRRLHGGCTI